MAEELESLLRLADNELLDDGERLDALRTIRANHCFEPAPMLDAVLNILTEDDAVAPAVASAAGHLLVERMLEQGADAEARLSEMSVAARIGASRALVAADAVRAGDGWQSALDPETRLRARRYLDAARASGVDPDSVAEEFSGGSAAVARAALAAAIVRACSSIGSERWIEEVRSPGGFSLEQHLDDAISLERVLAAGATADDLARVIRVAVDDAASSVIQVLEGIAIHPDLPGWRLMETIAASDGRGMSGREIGDVHPDYFRAYGRHRESTDPSS
jgi:hypothetical protein